MDETQPTPPIEEPIPVVQEEPPLAYEETPVVEPEVREASSPPPPPQKNLGQRILGTLGMFVLFLLLFVAGVWLSGMVRSYINSPQPTTSIETTPTPAPSVTPSSRSATPSAAPATGGWRTYTVISGITRQAIGGITLSLPSEVLPPVCDGTTCGSQGTYLPGGTRFTVAPRGAGQVLKDFRGSVISDLQGQAFTVTQTTIAGRPAVSFQANFTGSTSGGSTFGQMRGVMIEVTEGMSLELNHFTPTGRTADFAGDDKIFDEILARLVLGGNSGAEKGSTPQATPTSATSL